MAEVAYGEDFRRSIEASLPPLTQYSLQTSAPGVYGAWGWGMAMGGRAEVDSIRASRASASTGARASHDADLDLSASLRNSFAQYPPGGVHELRDSEVSLGGARTKTALFAAEPEAELQSQQPAEPSSPVLQPYPTNVAAYARVQSPAAAVYVAKQVLAPSAPPPDPGADGTVVVGAIPSPGGLYPSVPGQATPVAPRDDALSRPSAMAHRPQGPAGIPHQDQAATSTTASQGPATYYQYPQTPLQPTSALQQPYFAQQPQASPQSYYARQQPYQPHVGQSHYGANAVAQGKVVHMKRAEAWTKYIAYEGCLQVCMAEMERTNNTQAQHFIAGAFTRLRKDLGVDGLLLTQIAGLPANLAGSGADGGINDICWDDMESTEKRVNTVAIPNTSAASYMQIRCQRLSLPSSGGVLHKLWSRTRTQGSFPSLAGITVHLTPSDDGYDASAYTLDGQGAAMPHGQPVVFPLEGPQQHGTQLPLPPPQRLDIHVDGPNGVVAMGSVSYNELYRMALQQHSPVDEVRASSAGIAVDVQVRGSGEYTGKTATVSLAVARVRKSTAGYELAQVAPDGVNMDTVNKNTLRTNACLAYDTALAAALESNGCGRHKLLVEGPWEWLLANFASYFGVRSYYCMLAHLRWVLKPGVATISTMCLDVIAQGLQPLLEQSVLRGLTTHEATLLEGVKKAGEMLLEVAFENYYALGDDQPREGAETPRAQSITGAWRPTVLMASFRLFRVMKDVFLPSDQDWLNTRFRVAAKKRWHFLECNCGFDQIRDLPRGSQAQTRQQAAPKLGISSNSYDSYYKMAERMGLAIRSDLEFDMFLQKQQDLLPSTLNLPRITAEEYMANFVEILRNMLSKCPPLVPSAAAVDLLVATANLQRFLQETQLHMPRQHPGHLDAMELWRPHVLSWIDGSKRGLCSHCGKLEAEAKLTVAHLARVDVAKMPGMIEGIEGAVAPLVHDMLDRTWGELMLYERVIKNWSQFGPHLEAALCDVLRTVQGSLNRICAGASAAATMQQPLGSPHMHGGHRRVTSMSHATSSPGMHHGAAGGPGGMMHSRTMSNVPYGAGSPGMGGRGYPAGYQGSGAGAAPGTLSGGRIAVLLKEAVLLNSLKVLMVMVPSMEDIISKWCGGAAAATPPPSSAQDDYNDDYAHIGAQFAQAVKELRTDYAEGVASCANRLANYIRSSPNTNIKAALNQPKPPADPHGGYPGSTLAKQQDYVEAFMRPILAVCDESLQALRAALDPRVFVATGRALWDCMGKDLFEFVHFLQESEDNKGAWRLRQHANVALAQLCEFFRARLAASMEHCIGDRDLDLPVNVDKVHRLLAQNTAVVNITLNPI